MVPVFQVYNPTVKRLNIFPHHDGIISGRYLLLLDILSECLAETNGPK